MTHHICDLVIIGGGCAGLSLANQLAQQSSALSVHILEARSHYTNDKTWCFWSNIENEWTALAKQRWNQWSFQYGDHDTPIIHHGGDWYYYCLDAKSVYQTIQQNLLHAYQIKLQMNQTVATVVHADPTDNYQQAAQSATVTTTSGDIYTTKLVIDTRPPKKMQSTLYQSFFGIECKTQVAHENTAALMHNLQADEYGTRFNYILPISPNRVLFEHTRFSTLAIDKASMEAACQHEMERVGLEYSAIFRKEYGCLPMGQEKNDDPFAAGIAGGALRNASGYGFLRIQQWAQQIARQLAQPQATMTITDVLASCPDEHPWLTWMDKLFLNTIKANPEQSAYYFHRLTKHLNSGQFLRLMTDSPSNTDLIAIMYALPKWPFLKQLLASSRNRQPQDALV
jgi:lycopene beta-cyclase